MAGKIQVLLAEDNPTDVLLLEEALADATLPDFTLTAEERLAEVFQRLRLQHFDVVLLDLGLPDSQGFDTFIQVRDRIPTIPILVLTGLDDEELALRAVHEGAQDYLVKGQINGDELARAIRYAIERKQVEESLRGSMRLLQATVDALPASIAVLDQHGRVLMVNEAWRTSAADYEFLGGKATIGDSYLDICERAAARGDGSAAEVGINIRRVLRQETESFYLEYPGNSSREERWFALRVTSIHADGQRLTVVTQENITERKQYARELEALVAVAMQVRTALTVDQIVPALMEQVRTLLGAHGVALLLKKSDETLALKGSVGTWTLGDTDHERFDERVSRQVMESGHPFHASNLRGEQRQPFRHLHPRVESVACVPLISHQHILGVLWTGRRHAITSAELRILSAIAEIAASAIHRARLHEQTERRLQRLGLLREIDRAITSSVDMQIVLGILVDGVCEQLRVDAASVLLLQRSMKWLELAASRGFRAGDLSHYRQPMGKGLAGRVAMEQQVVHIPDLSKSPEWLRSARRGLEEFVSYYAVPLISKGQCRGVLEVFHRQPLEVDGEWVEFLEALAGQAAIAVEAIQLFTDLERSNLELTLAYEATLEGWSRALDYRDHETEGHTQRVTEGTLQLAMAMGIDEAELPHIRRGALLHDIGKMAIPDDILLKPGPLDEAEWEIMQKHPIYAYELLYPIPFLRPALAIPYSHHERWDGSGYPQGLKGEEIPLAARIFTVVDVWDALVSNRPYRDALSYEGALTYIRERAGSQFDPAVVQAFLTLHRGDTFTGRARLLIVSQNEETRDRLVSLFKPRYDVYVARSGAVALSILERAEIQLILTTRRLSDMSSVEFLVRASSIRPGARAILLASAPDVGTLTSLLRLGNVRDLIEPPWNEDEVARRVDQLLPD